MPEVLCQNHYHISLGFHHLQNNFFMPVKGFQYESDLLFFSMLFLRKMC